MDDFLIESSRNLVRKWHQATVQSVGVVVPDQPWERGGERGIANRLTARPFGGGALYDPRAQMVKLWYRCTCLPPACPKPPAFPYLSTPTCPTIQDTIRPHAHDAALLGPPWYLPALHPLAACSQPTLGRGGIQGPTALPCR